MARLKLVFAAVVVLAGVASGSTADPQTVERLTREVRRAVEPRRDGPDESVLAALRGLRDERLRPLLADLASRESAVARLHGIFGLAELSEDGHVNIVQISGLGDRDVRAMALGRAVGGGYLSTEQMRQVLGWPELEPGLELLVTSRLRLAGEEVSVERIDELASTCGADQVVSRVYAELLVAEMTGDGAAEAASATMEAVKEEDREALVAFAMGRVVSDELEGLGPFVERWYEWGVERSRVRRAALGTCIWMFPERGVEAWAGFYGAEESLSERIRLGLVLLGRWKRVEPGAYDLMAGDGEVELLGLMGRAGRAVSSGEGMAEALAALLGQNHLPTQEWALGALAGMEGSVREETALSMIGIGVSGRDPESGVPTWLYECARLVEGWAPGSLEVFLRGAAASGDAPLCEALLTAVLENEPHEAWSGEGIEWPSRRTRAMAVIAEARSGAGLSSSSEDVLVSAALGGEGLPRAFRVQAAWLALCGLEREREALASVLAPDGR